MSLPTQSEVGLKLDFDDLVKELDQFEHEAVELQGRIKSFITTATEAAMGPEEAAGDEPPVLSELDTHEVSVENESGLPNPGIPGDSADTIALPGQGAGEPAGLANAAD